VLFFGSSRASKEVASPYLLRNTGPNMCDHFSAVFESIAQTENAAMAPRPGDMGQEKGSS
jgi:hypothetical protein